MYNLCFLSNMSSAEWAAWVQAVGSILAILGAVGVAVWQTNKQHGNALALLAAERQLEKRELARTLTILAKNCAKAASFFADALRDREAVYNIAEGLEPLDVGELTKLDTAISAIPLHELPSSLVTPTMLLGSTIRQFREKIEMVLRLHRQMDAAAFEDFFRTLQEMSESLSATSSEIGGEVESRQNSQ